jgi:hypothetical protein
MGSLPKDLSPRSTVNDYFRRPVAAIYCGVMPERHMSPSGAFSCLGNCYEQFRVVVSGTVDFPTQLLSQHHLSWIWPDGFDSAGAFQPLRVESTKPLRWVCIWRQVNL